MCWRQYYWPNSRQRQKIFLGFVLGAHFDFYFHRLLGSVYCACIYCIKMLGKVAVDIYRVRCRGQGAPALHQGAQRRQCDTEE